MTSNIGAGAIAKNTTRGFSVGEDEMGVSYGDMKNRIMGELKKVFRPEFLNRIDDVIVFHKLAKDEIKQIVELLLLRIRASLAERGLQLELTEDARDLLVDKGWDPAMGARPLRRAIQRYIEDPLADEVLRQGEMPPGSTVMVERDPSGDEEDRPLSLTIVRPKKPARPKKSKPEPEKVGVGAGAKKDEGEDGGEPASSCGAGLSPSGPGSASPPLAPTPTFSGSGFGGSLRGGFFGAMISRLSGLSSSSPLSSRSTITVELGVIGPERSTSSASGSSM